MFTLIIIFQRSIRFFFVSLTFFKITTYQKYENITKIIKYKKHNCLDKNSKKCTVFQISRVEQKMKTTHFVQLCKNEENEMLALKIEVRILLFSFWF